MRRTFMVKRAGITVSCRQGIIRLAARNAEAEFRKSNIWGEVFITVHTARNKKPPDVTDTGGFFVDSISRLMELNEYATVSR